MLCVFLVFSWFLALGVVDGVVGAERGLAPVVTRPRPKIVSWRGARRPRRAAHRHWTCVSTAAGVCVLVCCCEGVKIADAVRGLAAVAQGARASGARADVALAVGKAIDRFCERRDAPRDVASFLNSDMCFR